MESLKVRVHLILEVLVLAVEFSDFKGLNSQSRGAFYIRGASSIRDFTVIVLVKLEMSIHRGALIPGFKMHSYEQKVDLPRLASPICLEKGAASPRDMQSLPKT